MGLRFWNQVDEDGESYWVFESRDVRLVTCCIAENVADPAAALAIKGPRESDRLKARFSLEPSEADGREADRNPFIGCFGLRSMHSQYYGCCCS